MALADPDIAPEQADVLLGSAVTKTAQFKSKMARGVIRALRKTPEEQDQQPIHKLLVPNDLDDEDWDVYDVQEEGHPITDLNKQFDENEAGIIETLYARHFPNGTGHGSVAESP